MFKTSLCYMYIFIQFAVSLRSSSSCSLPTFHFSLCLLLAFHAKTLFSLQKQIRFVLRIHSSVANMNFFIKLTMSNQNHTDFADCPSDGSMDYCKYFLLWNVKQM